MACQTVLGTLHSAAVIGGVTAMNALRTFFQSLTDAVPAKGKNGSAAEQPSVNIPAGSTELKDSDFPTDARARMTPKTTAGSGQPSNGHPKQKPDGVATSSKPSVDKKEFEALKDRRRELKRTRAAWVAVKTKAEADLEKVKEGARREYMADADQFPKIVQGCKSIDDILDNLDDELRDTLDEYVATPIKNQAKLIGLAAQASEILDRYLNFVANNALMKAIDLKE